MTQHFRSLANATYHKGGDAWTWFDANRHCMEVRQLPPYSPELNPTERLWRYTRRDGTHNRYFPDAEELTGTLSRILGEMQSCPEL
jgi:transposase